MLSKMLLFLLVLSLLKFANSFYYSNGLCPKLEMIDITEMPSVLLQEAYRFAEKTLKGYFDQGTCTLYSFSGDLITVSTYQACRFIKSDELYTVSHQEMGDGYKMTKVEPNQIGTTPKHSDNDFCKINEYLGNDNVSDTNILRFISKEFGVVVVLWGCDQINENVNKQKLIILTTSWDLRLFKIVDSLIKDLKNDINLNETVTEQKIEQNDIICGKIQLALKNSNESLAHDFILMTLAVVLCITAQ